MEREITTKIIRVLMVQLSIINPHTKKATFARLKFLWENTVFLSNTNDKAFAQRGKRYELQVLWYVSAMVCMRLRTAVMMKSLFFNYEL